ncbi:MAG: DUF6531 domain-containing protein, partial [Anaerovoracaceae bacterium]
MSYIIKKSFAIVLTVALLTTSIPSGGFLKLEKVSAAVTPTFSLVKRYIKPAEHPTVKWEGIPLSGISSIRYRIAAYKHSDGTTSSTNTVGETSIGKPSKSAGEKALGIRTAGCYRVYMWAMYGTTKKYAVSSVVHVDSSAPGISTLAITPTTSTTAYNKTYPTLNKTTKEISETHLKSVEYNIDSGVWRSFHLATTTTVLNVPISTLGNSGPKKVNVRATDHSGNVSAVRAYNYYFDKDAPEVGDAYLESNGTKKGTDWFKKDETLDISFTGLKDSYATPNITATPLATAGITYAITSASVSTAPTADKYKIGTGFSITGDNTNGYTGKLKLAATDANLADGEYRIYLKFKDKAANERIVKLLYKKDATLPEGKIIPKDLAGKEITELFELTQILSSFSDKSSGISRARAEIDLGTEKVSDLFTDRTTSTLSYLDTMKLANGDYSLVLNVRDKAGNERIEKKNIKINNMIRNLYLSPKKASSSTSTIKIGWEYFDTEPVLEKIQFKEPTASVWNDVLLTPAQKAATDKSGELSVNVSAGDGEKKILVRGVDSKGNVGKEIAVKGYVGEPNELTEGQLKDGTNLVGKPSNITAISNFNSKTIVRWDKPQNFNDKTMSYSIYRDTYPNFIPNNDKTTGNLISEKRKLEYFYDMNIVYDKNQKLYYKVCAVKDGSTGLDASVRSSFSDEVNVRGYDYREFLKRLGEKDSYSYLDMELPNANVMVEKSQGNAFYTQTDAELPNEAMPISFFRVYNSQSNMKGAFGLGFSHNYDISLLSPGMGTGTDFDSAIVKDDTGAIVTFQKEGSGKFVSDKGMYYSLEKCSDAADKAKGTYKMLSKDNLKYYFDADGVLVREEDSNGNYVTLIYDKDTGKLIEILAQSGRKIQLSYGTGDNKDLISEITLPGDRKVTYSYQSKKLIKITKVSKTVGVANTENVLAYAGTTDTANLTTIKDAVGNVYSIAYDGTSKSAKATKLTYPDGTNLRLAYNGKATETTTQKYINSTYLSTVKDVFESSFGNLIESTDEAGNKSSFTHMDCLTESSTSESEFGKIETDIFKKQSVAKISKTAYDTKTENVDLEQDEDGSETEYKYNPIGDNEFTDDLPDELIETDADGEETSHTSLTYDSKGNELTSKDSATGEENLNVYCTATDFGGNFVGELKKETVKGEEGLTTITDYIYALDASTGNRTDTVTETAAGVSKRTVTTTDPLGNQTYLKDSTGDETSNTYDDFGRLIKTARKIGEKTETTTKSYNANGSLLKETSPTGIVTSHSYDKMNRVTATTITKGTTSKTTTTTRGYMGAIRINTGMGYVSVANPFVTKEYIKGDSTPISETYTDRLGRTVREKSGGIYTDYTYDKQGKVLTAYKIGQSEKNANAG